MEYKEYSDKIPKWDPSDYFKKIMKERGAFNLLCSGNTSAGKSVLIKSLLVDLLPQFDFVLIFSRTLINGFYQSFINTKLLFDEYQDEVIYNFMKLSQEFKDKGKKMKWLVILDDCVDAKSKYQKGVTQIFYTGRHYGCSIIFLTQKASLLNTGWISNCQIFITLFAGSRNEKEYIANRVLADIIDIDFPNYKKSSLERLAYLIQSYICRDYNSLVILPYEDIKLFTYKAHLKIKDQK